MKILFVCTHNRCRSILCEAITNQLAKDQITAFSAGSEPSGEVHPLTIRTLSERGYSTDALRSQSWNEFTTLVPDVVITVCDSAANEPCPIWLGTAIKLHWGLPDPSRLEGDEHAVKHAFNQVIDTIEKRTQKLMGIVGQGLSNSALARALSEEIKAG
ncbi:arsenate reductase ArsC [Halioxenophilus sp. WMMB6]|uniref:arsenate reductase ArsC n=1 Tax=Halioxenophilus sp. WMMB6 TaxID=3073815 RepID=UPI00295E945B|nr:arsenate reductase ArsC [Halioxenophilus sp. WMMB6]